MIKRKKLAAIACVTPFMVVSLTPRQAEATPAVAAPVAIACISNPACVLGVLIIGGILYFTVTQGGQTVRVNAMIDDPEALTEEWPEEVWAFSRGAAQDKCEALAEAYTKQGGRRVSVKRVEPTRIRDKYKCVFEAEVG